MTVPTVLVVDDEYAVVQVLSDLLTEQGYEVVTAINGRQALQRLAEVKADMVLTDYMMPSLDGLGLIQEMRSHPATRGIPVILMSALPPEPTAGATPEPFVFLRKPFRVRAVLDAISAALSRPR